MAGALLLVGVPFGPAPAPVCGCCPFADAFAAASAPAMPYVKLVEADRRFAAPEPVPVPVAAVEGECDDCSGGGARGAVCAPGGCGGGRDGGGGRVLFDGCGCGGCGEDAAPDGCGCATIRAIGVLVCTPPPPLPPPPPPIAFAAPPLPLPLFPPPPLPLPFIAGAAVDPLLVPPVPAAGPLTPPLRGVLIKAGNLVDAKPASGLIITHHTISTSPHLTLYLRVPLFLPASIGCHSRAQQQPAPPHPLLESVFLTNKRTRHRHGKNRAIDDHVTIML